MSRPTFEPFDRVAVLGLGLLGGSVALAARRRGAALRVVGAGRRRAPLEAALARGLVDEIGSPEEMVEAADLVILGMPIGSMASSLERVAGSLAPGAIVTDVGSTKGELADSLPGLLPPGVSYLGSHPMAGSHLRGNAHARGDLLDGACCVVTPISETPEAVLSRVRAFWEALGARVVLRSPAAHDREVAWVSHVPHVLAFAFAEALGRGPEGAAEVAGSGFRDFTRIARSDAELWSEILGTNRKALAGPLQEVRRSLERLAAAIEADDSESQEELLSRARETLARVADSNEPEAEKDSAVSKAGPESANSKKVTTAS